ncbi:hypothetical protein, partial [Escherichia coli]
NTPGINVDFTGNAAGVTSFWAAFERSGGATRFMSTGGDTYVYTGGTVEIPGLGIKLSVGADIVPQISPLTTPAGQGGEAGNGSGITV